MTINTLQKSINDIVGQSFRLSLRVFVIIHYENYSEIELVIKNYLMTEKPSSNS